MSPTERPFSVSPLNTISVLCDCAFKARSASVCVSKSTLNTTMSLYLGSRVELDQDRVLRAAGGTPHGEDIDQDRLAGFLRLGEGGRVERLPFFGSGGKRADKRGGGNDDKKERAQANHPSDLLALPQDPAAIAAADRDPPITIA